MKSAPAARSNESAKVRRHSNSFDLFPGTLPPVPPPVIPTRGTVKDRALSEVIAGKITQLDFLDSWRLAAYIEDLIEDGWAIASEWVCLKGCKAPIKRYWIDLQDPSTRTAVSAYKAQRGFVSPYLIASLGVFAPAIGALAAFLWGWIV